MKLRYTFLKLGYKVSHADLGVFYKFSGNDKYTIIATATDDLTIIAESIDSAQLIKSQLNEHFEIVDLGEIKWLLSVHITRDLVNQTISLGQQSYIDDIVKRFGLEDARSASTPIEPSTDLTPGAPHILPIKLTAEERSNYREIIGSLLYCSRVTCADCAYAVSTLSRYLEDPSITHHAAAHRAILTSKKPIACDSNSVARTQNCTVTLTPTGHHKPIAIQSLDLPFFTVKVSYPGVPRSNQLLHSRAPRPNTSPSRTSQRNSSGIANFIPNYHHFFNFQPDQPIPLYCDNQGAIILSKDATFHMRTKHIDTRFHFVRETVNSNVLSISYCSTDNMIADIFTKSLACYKFSRFRSLLGIS
jgi:hypothetical protein